MGELTDLKYIMASWLVPVSMQDIPEEIKYIEWLYKASEKIACNEETWTKLFP